MDQLGDVFEPDWANTEEFEFMTRLLGEFGGEFEGLFGDGGGQLNYWPPRTSLNVVEDSFFYVNGDDINCMTSNILQDSSESDKIFTTKDVSCCYNYNSVEEDVSVTAQVCTDLMMLEDEASTFEAQVRCSMMETRVLDDAADDNITKKRPNLHNYEVVQKNKRNVKPRKFKKIAEIKNTDDSKGGFGALLTQTSSSNCLKNDDINPPDTEEFSNLTTEHSSTLNSGKTNIRANRGSTTDPQSLYARKRREKINHRLRILQGLVPNGTKVDISTMLDEAVQYVKFLQLQIKLLSSEDMWMYAPLAYNGMELGLGLGLDLKM